MTQLRISLLIGACLLAGAGLAWGEKLPVPKKCTPPTYTVSAPCVVVEPCPAPTVSAPKACGKNGCAKGCCSTCAPAAIKKMRKGVCCAARLVILPLGPLPIPFAAPVTCEWVPEQTMQYIAEQMPCPTPFGCGMCPPGMCPPGMCSPRMCPPGMCPPPAVADMIQKCMEVTSIVSANPGCLKISVEDEDQIKLDIQGSAGTSVTGKDLSLSFAGCGSYNVCVRDGQVRIAGPCLEASADKVSKSAQGDLTFEGHVELTFNKDGTHVDMQGDKVVVGLGEGRVEIKSGAGCESKK